MKIQEDGSLLHLEDPNRGTRTGLNSFFLRIVAVPPLLIGLNQVHLSIASLNLDFSTFFGMALVLLALVMLAGASGQSRLDFRISFRVDPSTGQLHLFKANPERALTVPLARIAHLSLVKWDYRRGEGGYFDTCAWLDDGSKFWLVRHYHGKQAVADLEVLSSVLGVSVVDHTSLGAGREATKTWPLVPEGLPEPSRFVEHVATESGQSWSLRKEVPLVERIVAAAVASFFLILPLGMGFETFKTAWSSPSFASFAALVMFSLVTTFMMLFALTLWGFTQRTYRVVVHGESLKIDQHFSNRILQRFIGRELLLPRSSVRAVRVHRAPEGAIRLDLVHAGQVTVQKAHPWLRQVAFFSPEKGDCLHLWDIAQGHQEGTAPDFADAAYLAGSLRAALGLQPAPVKSSEVPERKTVQSSPLNGSETRPLQSTAQQLMSARVIWFGFGFSHVMLAFLIFKIRIPQRNAAEAAALDFSPASILAAFLSHLEDSRSLALTVIAAAVAVLAFILPNLIHRASSRNQKTQSLKADPAKASPAFASFFLRMGLFESITLIGFVQAFALPGDPLLLFPFLVVGLGLHLTQFPRDIDLGFPSQGPKLPQSLS